MFFRPKVRPVPKFEREIKISRNPWKKRAKMVLAIALLIGLGVGIWIGISANRAIKKITGEATNKSSLFSFLDLGTGSLKGQAAGRTNILLLGMGGKNHPGGQLSDTIISSSINYKDNRLGLISIPRDLWAPIPGYGHAKINEAHADGEKDRKTTGGGGALASKTVENVLGIPIHYYVSLDFEGFKKIVDSVGGVDIYVEKDIYDPYYPADNMIDYSPFRISAGLHHMDGVLALKFARSRETTSDFDRSRRQQQVMSAVKEKFLTLNILANPKKVTDIINILGDHVRTNMRVEEIYAFWNTAKAIDMTETVSKVLDTSEKGPLTSSQDYRGYYIYPRKGIDNFSDLQALAKNLFSSAEVQSASQVKIEVLNGTNKKGIASTVRDYLNGYGYNVSKIGDAPAKRAKTAVFASSDKFSSTAQDIASKLGATVEPGQNETGSYDIKVVVGDDYLK